MFCDARKVLGLIKPNDRVLDIGGAAEVFPRANVVIDILPYDHRSRGQLAAEPEIFTRNDWYMGDICAPEVWGKFSDKEFDFVICSHVLEDIRDPIFVCSQMIRVGKAGYIECPSRFRECAKASPTDTVSGWEHHRWILDVEDGTLIFTPKFHWAHQFDYLGDARRSYLLDNAFNFTAVHWIDSFDYVERVTRGSPVEAENQFFFYDRFAYDNPNPFHKIERVKTLDRTFLWFTEFRLPIEKELPVELIIQRYDRRKKTHPHVDSKKFLRVMCSLFDRRK